MKLLPLTAILAAALTSGTAKRIVCYYTNWSRYGSEPFLIDNIDSRLCTYVVYSFMGLDEKGYMQSVDPWNDFGDEWTEGGLKKFQKLRNANPSVRLIAGVGGWNEGPLNFQKIIRSPELRRVFLNSSLNFIRRHYFDGLEIDLMYQDAWGGTPDDRAGLSALVQEMKPLYERNGYNLSIATSAHPRVFDNSYDISILTRNVDFVNVMTYDLHGSWDGKTGHVAPLHAMKGESSPERQFNVEAVIDRYIEKGAIPEKLVMAMVSYGRTFTLVYPERNGMNAPSKGAGKVEPLPYRTFCVQDNNKQWKKFWNEEQKVPYAASGDQWVGYEDVQSLREKVELSKTKKLGGISFWSFDMDDFKGICGFGKYPLLTAVKEQLSKN